MHTPTVPINPHAYLGIDRVYTQGLKLSAGKHIHNSFGEALARSQNWSRSYLVSIFYSIVSYSIV